MKEVMVPSLKSSATRITDNPGRQLLQILTCQVIRGNEQNTHKGILDEQLMLGAVAPVIPVPCSAPHQKSSEDLDILHLEHVAKS